MISRERVKKMYTHYRRRLRKYGMTEKDQWHALRTTGKPCSCYMCKKEKYNRKEKHKKNIMKENFEAL